MSLRLLYQATRLPESVHEHLSELKGGPEDIIRLRLNCAILLRFFAGQLRFYCGFFAGHFFFAGLLRYFCGFFGGLRV